ncbi:SKI family transcriptional corepressor 1 homolog-B-like [Hoplias malabaricus]|uniref:SKI family transcriptional corepressor 1 homolog-B-like n=1 Tax=Hoplias malabaricus TaxID=27720 RepID=UPI00346295F6
MDSLIPPLSAARDSGSSPRPAAELQSFPGGGGGGGSGGASLKANHVSETSLYGVPIVSLLIDGQERLCLAQISNTLLKNYSYNEIHNRRVALGITCVQCTPVQLEILRRAGAMPVSSRRCGMITKREAERLCKSFLGAHSPPKLPENFAFDVTHACAWGCRGSFVPARYNSSRAKCIKCAHCGMYFSPNKFIFHSHRAPDATYTQPDAANFNSWRRHLKLSDRDSSEHVCHAWEDVKAMFNGGSRKRTLPLSRSETPSPLRTRGPSPEIVRKTPRSGAMDEERAIAGVRAPSYPLVPLPSKGFGALHKLHTPFFPHPYGGFPAFQKKEGTGDDGGASDAHKTAAVNAVNAANAFWSGAKDAPLYPAFPVFWPAAGGLHVPGYPHHQERVKAHTDLVAEACVKAHGELALEARVKAHDENERGGAGRGTPAERDTHVSHVSAFRPVLRDAESIAKLYGHRESHVSPERAGSSSSSSSCRSVSPDADSAEEDPDVDVESSRAPEEEAPLLQHSPRGQISSEQEHGREEEPRGRGTCSPASREALATEEEGSASEDRDSPACEVCDQDAPAVCVNSAPAPAPAPASAPRYTLTPPTPPAPPTTTTHEPHRSSKKPVESENQQINHEVKEKSMDGVLRTENRFHFIQKDIENMAKEELQKQLVEQMELRKKMEREFQSLKDHFQDQMKRELSYREEMVQQLHIVRDTLCNELDQERKARYAIQQKLKAHDALHHFSCKMLTPRHCTGTCTFKPPLLPP